MALSLPPLGNCKVAIIGLGYVGLPLAVEFAKIQNCLRSGVLLQRQVIGFDINTKRLEELSCGIDRTNEITSEELQIVDQLLFTDDPAKLVGADVFVITVPTPIDKAKRPDLTPLELASATVGRALKQYTYNTAPIVIVESTVYPGATEDLCVPIIEKESGLRFNKEFFCGYSPERINPGDKEHKLITITKVTSGSTIESAAWVDNFYGSIIKSGTHPATSIKVAEAAKVIENTQRDLNIALVNELSIIFSKLGIDTLDVLKAAGSKWNFLRFKPGLVGGHCIGVDPYYLTHKAEELGYHPQVVLAGRRINDGMGKWLGEQLVLKLAQKGQSMVSKPVLILGLTFKENCSDLRNTKVIDMINCLQDYGAKVDIVDPFADPEDAMKQYSLVVSSEIPANNKYIAIVVAVAHKQFIEIDEKTWLSFTRDSSVIFDIKGVVPRSLNPMRL